MNIPAIIIGVLGATMLLAASIIDFVLSAQQKNDVNKNTLMAAGVMTLVASGIIVYFMFRVNSDSKNILDK